MRTNVRFGTALVAALALAACGGAKDSPSTTGESAASPAAQAAPAGGPQTPDAGGKVVTVEMLTDEQGNNIFRPNEVTASKGDVVRYTLVSGV